VTLKLGDEAVPGPITRVYRGALRKSCLTCRVIVDDSEQVTGTPQGGSSTRENSQYGVTGADAADRGLSCERPKDAQFRATSGREPVMKEKLRFLGLDVHAETIAVAVAEPEGEVRSLGTIPNRAESIRKLIKKLGPADKLRACYEAGPTGYVVYWQLAELGVECEVVAPTLVPVKAGDRVKTDRRDAEKLARCYRSGDLTAVWVPDEGSEALRDLVRAREAAKQDQTRARHRECTGTSVTLWTGDIRYKSLAELRA